jgi:arylsulfatase A-like enzyme
MYARLDRDIGSLLDAIDALVGRDEYVVALTADHGVSMIPEQARQAGRDAGRIMAAAVIEPLEQRLNAVLGPGKYVARLSGDDLYFNDGVYDKLEASPDAMKAAVTTLAATPGIQRVFRREELRDGAKSNDPLLRAAALSYFEGRSGDLVIALKPGWMFGSTGTTHGNASIDDKHVPIVFMGRGVKPGRYMQAVTPADVAPTLAALSGVTLPKAEGHVLRMAVTVAPGGRPVTSHSGSK